MECFLGRRKLDASGHVDSASKVVTSGPWGATVNRLWKETWNYSSQLAEGSVGYLSQTVPKPFRQHVIILHDATAAILSLPVAAYLRFGTLDLPPATSEALLILAPVFAVLFILMSVQFETHLGLWYHCSIHDFRSLALAVTTCELILFGVAYRHWDNGAIPWSLPIIQWLGLLAVLVGSRLIYRLLHGGGLAGTLRIPTAIQPDGCTIVIGCDDSAAWFLRALQATPTRLSVVGIVDPDAATAGRRIMGVPLLGRLEALPKIIEQFELAGRPIANIVLLGRLSVPLMKRILEDVGLARIALYRVPNPLALADAKTCGLDLQPVAIEDLLGRPVVKPDLRAMAALLTDECILVTGAGGSVGSELVRQILGYHPAKLVLVDNCEFNLYQIDRQLSELFPDQPREAVLCDVRCRDQLMTVFRANRPGLVFHAAALKHVPMVELNPCEGMLTNAIGSRNVADAALEYGARAMVQISTDKAVNPTSVMGASKRLAEFYCQALDSGGRRGVESRCRFMTVRFGNVLGSSGSVVPLFQQQLERGGPLTVTHPDVTRYFMTIGEAVGLILHASANGIRDEATRGEIFVLDMGEPIRVVDLARQMIRIAGLVPDQDVAIEFVGLRPGEKLFEELFDSSERRLSSRMQGVLAATSQPMDLSELNWVLDDVERAAERRDRTAVLQAIARLIPGYGAAGVDAARSAVPQPKLSLVRDAVGAASVSVSRPTAQAAAGGMERISIVGGVGS